MLKEMQIELLPLPQTTRTSNCGHYNKVLIACPPTYLSKILQTPLSNRRSILWKIGGELHQTNHYQRLCLKLELKKRLGVRTKLK